MSLIKNCGLKSPIEIETAARTGASFFGMVYHTASPRHVDIPVMAALNLQKPIGIQSVVVLVAPALALVEQIVEVVKPDFLQLHNTPAPQIAEISERSGCKLILGVAMKSIADVDLAKSLEPLATHLLLDAPESGSGTSFDWNLLAHIKFAKPWFLAGGLTAENVAEAIKVTRAPMVDVSSGLEDSPGHKSLEKIAAFNKAVLATQ